MPPRSGRETSARTRVCAPKSPHPVQEHELSLLEPTLQLQCRARVVLGDEVEIKRAARGAVIKRKGTH
eukprot:3958010-Prymnesium_polylepis.1